MPQLIEPDIDAKAVVAKGRVRLRLPVRCLLSSMVLTESNESTRRPVTLS